MERRLWEYCNNGRAGDVHALLFNHPHVDVNWKNKAQSSGFTPLHVACISGHDKVVRELLKHPEINVNSKEMFCDTPLWIACRAGHLPVIKLLMDDPRVLVNAATSKDDYNPLEVAARNDHLDCVQWMIASGREVKEEKYREYERLNMNQSINSNTLVALLNRFEADPIETRRKVRAELGITEQLAAEAFALVIFLCDGLFRLRESTPEEGISKSHRFFRIAQRLPMDLQMLLCNKHAGSMKTFILSRCRESAFKDLGEKAFRF